MEKKVEKITISRFEEILLKISLVKNGDLPDLDNFDEFFEEAEMFFSEFEKEEFGLLKTDARDDVLLLINAFLFANSGKLKKISETQREQLVLLLKKN